MTLLNLGVRISRYAQRGACGIYSQLTVIELECILVDNQETPKPVTGTPRFHGWTSPLTEVFTSLIQGLGLRAKTAIPKGTIVVVWGGRITTHAELEELALRSPEIGFHYALSLPSPVPTDERFYIAETAPNELDDSDRVNHCCDPNCEIKGLFLITLRDVVAGEELTADFEAGDGDDFDCNCRSPNCRGRKPNG